MAKKPWTIDKRNTANKVEGSGVTRKTNMFGLAESVGRNRNAYAKNVGGTNESGKKFMKGMDKLKK